MRRITFLAAGFLVALVIAADASTSDVSVQDFQFSPATTSVHVNDDVKFTWAGAAGHNVTWEDGTPGSGTQTSGTHQRTFTGTGTFRFRCTLHSTDFTSGMSGSITVTQDGTTTGTGTGTTTTQTGTSTGTSTTPDPGTQPTDTTTSPTQTQIEQNQVDEPPAFTGTIKKRATKKAFVLSFGSSEDATLKATVYRRPPRGRAFSKVSQHSRRVDKGSNTVKLLRKRPARSGAYRLKLQLVDSAGNTSVTKTLNLKVA